MIGDETIREYPNVNLGVAVARPDDGLVIAPIQSADLIEPAAFSSVFMRQLRRAVRGQATVDEDVQILLTHLGAHGVVDAIPTLVSPASSILFLGGPDHHGRANVTVTFDHRLMNGAGAATFLSDLQTGVDTWDSPRDDQ
jgi:pyruvate/2-oxoglutarate dehydrogenase complex dihydrolipoamide acyltransferase (E2) component